MITQAIIEAASKNTRTLWLPLGCTVLISLAAFAIVVSGFTFELEVVLYAFIAAPLLGLLWWMIFVLPALIQKDKEVNPTLFWIVAVYWATTALFFSNTRDIHRESRWLLHSREMKAEVLSQPAVPKGELRHIDFDGWGFAGMDTTEYLVYEPSDSLGRAARDQSEVRFPGIPCEFPEVHRMEQNWYVVLFYTDREWAPNGCG